MNLKYLSNRTEDIRIEHPIYQHVDKLCIPMLDAFNNILGMKTVQSCCGHYEENGGYILFDRYENAKNMAEYILKARFLKMFLNDKARGYSLSENYDFKFMIELAAWHVGIYLSIGTTMFEIFDYEEFAEEWRNAKHIQYSQFKIHPFFDDGHGLFIYGRDIEMVERLMNKLDISKEEEEYIMNQYSYLYALSGRDNLNFKGEQ